MAGKPDKPALPVVVERVEIEKQHHLAVYWTVYFRDANGKLWYAPHQAAMTYDMKPADEGIAQPTPEDKQARKGQV